MSKPKIQYIQSVRAALIMPQDKWVLRCPKCKARQRDDHESSSICDAAVFKYGTGIYGLKFLQGSKAVQHVRPIHVQQSQSSSCSSAASGYIRYQKGISSQKCASVQTDRPRSSVDRQLEKMTQFPEESLKIIVATRATKAKIVSPTYADGKPKHHKTYRLPRKRSQESNAHLILDNLKRNVRPTGRGYGGMSTSDVKIVNKDAVSISSARDMEDVDSLSGGQVVQLPLHIESLEDHHLSRVVEHRIEHLKDGLLDRVEDHHIERVEDHRVQTLTDHNADQGMEEELEVDEVDELQVDEVADYHVDKVVDQEVRVNNDPVDRVKDQDVARSSADRVKDEHVARVSDAREKDNQVDQVANPPEQRVKDDQVNRMSNGVSKPKLLDSSTRSSTVSKLISSSRGSCSRPKSEIANDCNGRIKFLNFDYSPSEQPSRETEFKCQKLVYVQQRYSEAMEADVKKTDQNKADSNTNQNSCNCHRSAPCTYQCSLRCPCMFPCRYTCGCNACHRYTDCKKPCCFRKHP